MRQISLSHLFSLSSLTCEVSFKNPFEQLEEIKPSKKEEKKDG